MVVRETSLLAFTELRGKETMESRVLEAIRRASHPMTDYELAEQMGFRDPNHVRPRRRELVRKGLVEEAGRRICRVTGKTALTWRVSGRR